jgi:hypothetical protein
VNKTEGPLSKTLQSENTATVTKIQIKRVLHTIIRNISVSIANGSHYLHWIFSPGRKQGPVMLTTVPPNILPLSGANINGRFAPAETESL